MSTGLGIAAAGFFVMLGLYRIASALWYIDIRFPERIRIDHSGTRTVNQHNYEHSVPSSPDHA